MIQRHLRPFARRVTAVTAATVLAVLAPGFAGAEPPATDAPAVATIEIEEVKPFTPRFVGAKTVTEGEALRIVNKTSAKKMGPHTLSLVEPSELPRTPSARKQCFAPNHICMAIARWHGAKGNGPPTKNPAEAGAKGWDTEGNLTEKGDSWFTGSKRGAEFEQAVSARAGETLHFVCAIHPWMQGSVRVVAPSTTAPAPAPSGY